MDWQFLQKLTIIQQIAVIALSVLGIIYSIILHEIAHGYAALLGGDDTAKRMGRLSFNPIRHVDLVGTLILPGGIILLNTILGQNIPVFGWAKPVPVSPMNLRTKKDLAFVSLAGVITNFAILLLMLLLIFIFVKFFPAAWFLIYAFITIGGVNIILVVFNILPLPPLDGYNFLISVLPNDKAVFLEKNKMILTGILLALVFLGLLKYIYGPVFNLYEIVLNAILKTGA
ncbi:MAG: hypothetical protein A2Y33_08120 [Spirochaetes bacterium GWF1_51_8]|nr:MAG: hypothetical protein A2Y33_08120 [Spirochaetes bacterium GWF1_51_8]